MLSLLECESFSSNSASLSSSELAKYAWGLAVLDPCEARDLDERDDGRDMQE